MGNPNKETELRISGLVLALVGVAAVVIGSAAMFAEGIRADETQTTGAFSPLDILLVLGGICAVVVGLSLVFAWYAARRSRER